MQQYSRSMPRQGARANSPSTNPVRTNNPRDQTSDRSSEFESISYSSRNSIESSAPRPIPSGERAADQDKDLAKLKQITQRFFTKAALTIVSSRVDLPQNFHPDSNQLRTNKWFNLLLDESDQLAEDVLDWATVDVLESQPKPLIIEIYLDTAELARNQTLAVIDERGTKWDVRKALEPPSATVGSHGRSSRNTRIILERWKISVGESGPGPALAESPPNVYKRAVVLFRALYSFLHLMPAWKLGRRIAKEPATLTSLQPSYRILNEESTTRDTLSFPLYPASEPVTETHTFPATRCSTGSLQIQVTYRTNCDFRLNDSDALLSSHFMGIDDQHFRPSLDDTAEAKIPYWMGNKDVGSLPTERRYMRNEPDPAQAYGSMSTFHNIGPGTGTSPLSALRAARGFVSQTPPDLEVQKMPPDHRTSQSSKSSLRSTDGVPSAQRRVSVSFQPFKAGSLSSSPGFGPLLATSPRGSAAGTSDISRALAQSRNRTSLTTLPQTALRAPPQPSPEPPSGSPSPSSITAKPPTITRYSSSFSNRRSRISTGSGGASKMEEENSSSVRGSQSSSNQPGSGLLAEGGSGSSGSARTDEDNIADFLKMLDQKRDLKSFTRGDESTREASTKRTSAALNKYQRLRESHSVLTDSITSSMMLPRSSSSSGRGPPLLAGNSVSTSSSPGKPISPHTPHYPAIPSRLSANATVEELESSDIREQARSRRSRRDASSDEDATTSSRHRTHGSTPMDIPTSPQRYPIIRRSSSAAQRRHISEDLDEFGLRSSSLPLEERPDLSLTELLALQQRTIDRSTTAPRVIRTRDSDSRPTTADIPEQPSSLESQEIRIHRPVQSQSQSLSITNPVALRTRFRGGGAGGGRGSPSSFGGGSGESSRAGRYGASASSGRPGTADDDEPLLFTMSELANELGTQTQPSRRTGEELEADRGSETNRNERGGTPEYSLAAMARRGSRRGGGGGRSLW